MPVKPTGPHPYRASEFAEAVALGAARVMAARWGGSSGHVSPPGSLSIGVVFTKDVENLGPGLAADGMARSSGLARGASGLSIAALAQSTSPSHKRPARMSGVSSELPDLEELPDQSASPEPCLSRRA